ncbi:hypothetical protein NEF87_001924 [Candidatus Lokiarchaeum ossiferum]|uniref:Uncharacterized protein n=1 Tax=Candidatus Lokiarchaeum ossiferum TaxID=2951803 RepID=A0ABY6HQ55_9ARCH|nr:hypothetical protein NEF87_001924 [Candidatus Lokiarchaeum sp. B-35]
MSVQVNIQCPSCGFQKKIPVSEDYVKNKDSGTAIIKIPMNVVCQHKFFAYIDKNFVVRDYLLPQFEFNNYMVRVKEIHDNNLLDITKTNLDFEYLLSIISGTDLRSLIYACFIESPIILIENDFNHQRFKLLASILTWVFPKIIETCLFLTPEEFLTYSQEHPEKLTHCTTYNLPYKLSVQKPFLDHQSEMLQDRLEEICVIKSKSHLIKCKNKFDYLSKYAEFVVDYPEFNVAKLVKMMKKKFPEQKDLFIPENIQLMRDKINFTHIVSFPDLDPSASIGPIFIWNDDIGIDQIENVSNIIEKLCLTAIYEAHKISLHNLLEGLQKFAVVKIAKLTSNSLIKIMEKYIKKEKWLLKQ